jgi:hypothetical protein
VLPCIGSQDQRTLAPSRLDRADQARQVLAHLARAEARDQRQAPGFVFGIELGHQDLEVVLGHRGAAFQADRVLHAAGELHMRAVGLRVRSPIQIMWPEPASHLPGGRIEPVSASSYSSSSASCEV